MIYSSTDSLSTAATGPTGRVGDHHNNSTQDVHPSSPTSGGKSDYLKDQTKFHMDLILLYFILNLK